MCKKIFLTCIFIFLFITEAFAGEGLSAHYIAVDKYYNEFWVSESLHIENLILDDQVIIVYLYLFKNGDFFPPDIDVISVQINDGSLILNVSDDILYYYGSYMDLRLRAQIIKTALDIPGINNITLLIEGEERPLLEGGVIKEADECLTLNSDLRNADEILHVFDRIFNKFHTRLFRLI